VLGLEEAVVTLAQAHDVPQVSVADRVRTGDQVLRLQDELTVLAVATTCPCFLGKLAQHAPTIADNDDLPQQCLNPCLAMRNGVLVALGAFRGSAFPKWRSSFEE